MRSCIVAGGRRLFQLLLNGDELKDSLNQDVPSSMKHMTRFFFFVIFVRMIDCLTLDCS